MSRGFVGSRTWLAFCALLGWTLVVALPPTLASADTGRWGEPTKISQGTLGGWWPAIAADNDGNVHIVWNGMFNSQIASFGKEAGPCHENLAKSSQNMGPLFYTSFDGRTWSPPNDIALLHCGLALRSSIATDASGRLLVAYKGLGALTPEAMGEGLTLGQKVLWFMSADPGQGGKVGSWSAPVHLGRGDEAYFSNIVVDSHGVIHIAWTEVEGERWGLYYSNSSDGGRTWSPRIPLDENNFVWWYRIQLKIDSQDRLFAVWELTNPTLVDATLGFGSTNSAVYSMSADGGRSWARTPLQPTSAPGEAPASAGPQQPAIGVDGAGVVLLVYRQPDSNVVLFQRSSNGGARWSTPESLPGVKSGVARPYDMFDMATDGAGHVHIVLVGFPTNSDVMSLLHLEWNGAAWSTPQTIASAPPYPEFPKLAISSGNRLHVSWFSGDRATTDRVPIGIWYSSASTSAPEQHSVGVVPTSAPTEVVQRRVAQSTAVPVRPLNPIPDYSELPVVTNSQQGLPLLVAFSSVAVLLIVVILRQIFVRRRS